MKPIYSFITTPAIPPRLERLVDLAYNLRWSWNQASIALFRRLDSDLWETSGHNPVKMLGTIDQPILEAAATDEGFLSHLDGVVEHLDRYMKSDTTWFSRLGKPVPDPLVAYFSLEFGITECMSIFAGGLGILAGDHLKSASDLGVPLVGVGLLYQQGYFSQYLNDAGWQQEAFDDNDFYNLPVRLLRQPNGSPRSIIVQYPGREVIAQIWKAQVGRIDLYLLDTNVPENQAQDRDITDQLYGGDSEMRIKQEVLLGIGGMHTLAELGLEPTIFHMNEGHSAFLSLERIRRLMVKHNLTFTEAREAHAAGCIFTTHTPVPAGHDYFPAYLMDRYLGDYMGKLGLSRHDFLALGRINPDNDNEPFCMTILALRTAAYSNGVSRLHGQVSREAWRSIWPGVPLNEIPISHVTNGVHFRSWISREMDQLYERYLGMRWQEEPADQTIWKRAALIPSEELWRTHERRRERLVAFTRNRLQAQVKKRQSSRALIEEASEVLDSQALTIGFARRFATYKRAALLFRDPERLARILNNPDRPVQIIFAGKAHPRDDPGKALIQRIVNFARQEKFRHRIVFLENYDMAIARSLVQGADVWLNNPLRPQEASGTSGMKAAANGVLNLSTLDGWWDEAYTPEVGWAIGRGEIYNDPEYQEQVEAEALYDLLEREIVPAFYERGKDGLPRRWIEMMKASIQHLCSNFNTHRMVGEYVEKFYLPAAASFEALAENKMARARALAAWKTRIQQNWSQVRVESVDTGAFTTLKIGSQFTVRAEVHLGELTPDDVSVELHIGSLDANNEIIDAHNFAMLPVKSSRERTYLYEISPTACCTSGLHGYTIRVLPRHPDLVTPFLPGMIVWA
ncbi:MAG TPA: alpha-glucan family phosphorylase [Anaerolineaceae bacterium]